MTYYLSYYPDRKDRTARIGTRLHLYKICYHLPKGSKLLKLKSAHIINLPLCDRCTRIRKTLKRQEYAD